MRGLHTLTVGHSTCGPEQDDYLAPGFLIAWGTDSKQKDGICRAEMDEAAQNSPREQCELRIVTPMR